MITETKLNSASVESAPVKICSRCHKKPSVNQEKGGFCQLCRENTNKRQKNILKIIMIKFENIGLKK